MRTNPDVFFVALATDSLGLARPWNSKNPNKDPHLATNFTHTYPYLLKKRLVGRLENKQVEVNCFANRASGIKMAASKARDLFSWLDADVSVFHFGIVDCWLRGEDEKRPNVGLDEFERIFSDMMQTKRSLDEDQLSVFVGICPTNARTLDKTPGLNDQISRYNKVILDGMGVNCRFVDMERAFEKFGERLLHPDGHHLSNFGHEYVCEAIYNIIVDHCR